LFLFSYAGGFSIKIKTKINLNAIANTKTNSFVHQPSIKFNKTMKNTQIMPLELLVNVYEIKGHIRFEIDYDLNKIVKEIENKNEEKKVEKAITLSIYFDKDMVSNLNESIVVTNNFQDDIKLMKDYFQNLIVGGLQKTLSENNPMTLEFDNNFSIIKTI
jgi:hypothetical protein